MKIAAFKKIVSMLIIFAVVIGTCIIPNGLNAEATAYLSDNIYDFEANSGTLYSGKITDSFGEEREISRAHFSCSDD